MSQLGTVPNWEKGTIWDSVIKNDAKGTDDA